jgi:bacillithiol system protein YtxJ
VAESQIERRAEILRTPEDVDAFLKAHPDAVLFKAGTCHRTDRAIETLDPLLGSRSDLALGLIHVVDARAASQRVSEATGVRHQSPQVLLLRRGRVVLARDNWDISTEALAEALTTHFDALPGETGGTSDTTRERRDVSSGG